MLSIDLGREQRVGFESKAFYAGYKGDKILRITVDIAMLMGNEIRKRPLLLAKLAKWQTPSTDDM